MAVERRVTRAAPAEQDKSPAPDLPDRLDVTIGPGGRVVIPAAFRAAMGIKEGDRLMGKVVDGELRLISPKMAVRRAQRLVRELIPGDDSLADELIADRQREAEREMRDG
jgi:AbrB family looped-hinge helix DNA binding protein